jgi:hypothetical protein
MWMPSAPFSADANLEPRQDFLQEPGASCTHIFIPQTLIQGHSVPGTAAGTGDQAANKTKSLVQWAQKGKQTTKVCGVSDASKKSVSLKESILLIRRPGVPSVTE